MTPPENKKAKNVECVPGRGFLPFFPRQTEAGLSWDSASLRLPGFFFKKGLN
jgi:hypothetical protein